jgi:hypothetical protein
MQILVVALEKIQNAYQRFKKIHAAPIVVVVKNSFLRQTIILVA